MSEAKKRIKKIVPADYVVLPGKTVCCKKGTVKPGGIVKAKDVTGGLKTLEFLASVGAVEPIGVEK